MLRHKPKDEGVPVRALGEIQSSSSSSSSSIFEDVRTRRFEDENEDEDDYTAVAIQSRVSNQPRNAALADVIKSGWGWIAGNVWSPSSQRAGMTFYEFLSFGFPQGWADWLMAASQGGPLE